MNFFQLHNFLIVAGLWALINGILHDVFVLIQRRPFDRDLIRLLIDGHILIFSGIIFLVCYRGVAEHDPTAHYVALTVSGFLLGYCALIFKILPSIGTIIVNLIAAIWLLAALPSTKII